MPQKISRSKIELFLECPRCFWLEVKKGVKRPSGFPFTLNLAVDYLLKQEFDHHRKNKTPHPVMVTHMIEAVPFDHPSIDTWRHNFTGIQFHHKTTDLLVFGAVDDIWENKKGELMVVDYKATGAQNYKIYDSYARQMEIYQWLLTQNKFKVSSTGYFVFAKVNKTEGFGFGKAALSFDLFVEPYTGDHSWVEKAIENTKKTLDQEKSPDSSAECEYCKYNNSVAKY
ncbi:MAG: PD-(D/E)XK nuclease family protein [Candidatus Liptonbacteria bacterium]|nr:PD-(D/E)XK nuclease family protein [Candidatus Liptonbacteria bacterium]